MAVNTPKPKKAKPAKKAAPKKKVAAKKKAPKKSPGKKNPGGRPTIYRAEYAEKAYKLCLLGCTDSELADFLDVSEQTLNVWKAKHPKFVESIKDGKEKADTQVAEKLYHRALGYTHPETKAQWVTDSEGGRWEYAELQKHYPPDTQAASLWLRNRQPHKWRDKHDVEATGPSGGPIQLEWTVKFEAADK